MTTGPTLDVLRQLTEDWRATNGKSMPISVVEQWLDGATPEQTLVPTEVLRALFDCAVGSMNFASGFWDNEETAAARAVAVLLGVDPWAATPREHGVNYPHPFDTYYPGADWADCRRCGADADHPCHRSAEPATEVPR